MSRWRLAIHCSSMPTYCTVPIKNRSPHPRWSMICCYNAARNDPTGVAPSTLHASENGSRRNDFAGWSEKIWEFTRRRSLVDSGGRPERREPAEQSLSPPRVAIAGYEWLCNSLSPAHTCWGGRNTYGRDAGNQNEILLFTASGKGALTPIFCFSGIDVLQLGQVRESREGGRSNRRV